MAELMNPFERIIQGLPIEAKKYVTPRKRTPKPKRNSEQLIYLGALLGLKVSLHTSSRNTHGVYSMVTGEGIHWLYGTYEIPHTLREVEIILEEYASENELNIGLLEGPE